MKRVLGICYVGRHIKDRGFVILQFKSSGGQYPSFSMVGPVVFISNEDMYERGLSIVLQHSRNALFSTAENLCFSEEKTKKEMFKLKHNHVLVSVEILGSDIEEMKIIPLHFGRGWRTDRDAEEVQTFPVPITNNEFLGLLNVAFETAS
ncbi:MAG TPA: hypothetical protein VN048_03170 [Verrucomicrobiae bacterium]|jgi:hypothetical protein|nr:hypothetical protein [Verrucomicrobiae bacterium]